MIRQPQDDNVTIADLRECGFAVAVFSPDELEGYDPNVLEQEIGGFVEDQFDRWNTE